MKVCLHCGKQLRDDTKKCFFCGEMADELPQQKQSLEKWKKNKDIIILIAVILGCIIIYLMKK